jgi:hypothetical protein
MSSQPAIDTICSTLNEGEERPRSQVTAIVETLGEIRAMALLAETQRIELSGGMLVPDGSRRRTPGGVFFVLARRALSPHDRDRIFSDGRQQSPAAPKPVAPAPTPPRAAPPPNNGNTARRFENRPYQSSGSYSGTSGYSHGSSNAHGSNAHGRTHTYTAHGSTRQTTVEFSSRLAPQAARPVVEPPPPPAPAPPKPPNPAELGQKLVPLRRRIVSLPALQPEVKPPEQGAEPAAEASSGKGTRGRRKRGENSTADGAANDTTPAKPEAADLIRARTAMRELGSEDRRLLLLEMVDELGSDRDPTKPKFGLRDLVLSKLAAGLALGHDQLDKLVGSSNSERASEAGLSQLAPHQLERIDRFVTLLVDSLDPEDAGKSGAEANGASSRPSALSGVGAELEMRTRQFATRLHALVRSATLQSVQQAFSGAAARRTSSAPPPSRRAARKPARQPKRPSGRRKPKKRGR